MDDQTKNLIQNHIDNNEVCLFMKGTPDAPQCGFSMAVSNLLKHLEIKFVGINVLEKEEIKVSGKVSARTTNIKSVMNKRVKT